MSTAAQSATEHAALGRKAVWKLARRLKRGGSPWALEYFKACLGPAEVRLGALLVSAHAPDPSTLSPKRSAATDLLHFLLAAGMGLGMLLMVLLRFTSKPAGTSVGAPGQTLLAVHGEWSNRTRHLLSRVHIDLQPEAIIVLGRPQMSLADVARRWKQELPSGLPPLLVPQSWWAFLLATPALPVLLARGFRHLRHAPLRPPLREHAALSFRVMLGSVQQQWWRLHGGQGAEVLFGHTGLGDTTQLELQMQLQNCSTAHVIHGICTGPNFVGFSSRAIFQCGADADQYGALGHYGQCESPPAKQPKWLRGSQGVLLLTNLAHPMNPGYQQHGIADELAVINMAVELANRLGADAQPMHWRPHPVIGALPQTEQQALRDRAMALGLKEVPAAQDWLALAPRMRWVFTTPSTTLVELLRQGCLPLLLDPQDSVHDGAASRLPLRCKKANEDCQRSLEALDSDNDFQAMQLAAWNAVRPADVAPLVRSTATAHFQP